MDVPEVQRDGDEFVLTWPVIGIGLGLDHLREHSEGLHAEVTVESIMPDSRGRLLGPARLNLVSAESQVRFANVLFKRNGLLEQEEWLHLVVQACAKVTELYREPPALVDLSEVEDVGPVEYLIPGFLPKDETTILFGDGGSSKSLLALMLASCCRLGTETPWRTRPTEQVSVLYLDWETNKRTAAGRLQRIAEGRGWERAPRVFYRQMYRTLEESVSELRQLISKEKIGLVVVDSIGFACHGPLVEDQTARGAMNALRALSPATRLVVAHVSQESAKQTSGPVRPFGSAYFYNGMRSGWEVRRADDRPNPNLIEVGVYHRKANDGNQHAPIGLTVSFAENGGRIMFLPADVQEVPELAARTSLSGRIWAALRDGALTTGQIAEEVDAKENAVRVTLGRMSNVIQLNPGGGRGHQTSWGRAYA